MAREEAKKHGYEWDKVMVLVLERQRICSVCGKPAKGACKRCSSAYFCSPQCLESVTKDVHPYDCKKVCLSCKGPVEGAPFSQITKKGVQRRWYGCGKCDQKTLIPAMLKEFGRFQVDLLMERHRSVMFYISEEK